jgi:hypothetical protein
MPMKKYKPEQIMALRRRLEIEIAKGPELGNHRSAIRECHSAHERNVTR